MSDEAGTEERVSRGEMIALLRTIADSMEAGRECTVQVGDQTIPVPGQAEVQVEYERDGDSEELEIELSWNRNKSTATKRSFRSKAGIGLSLAAAAIAGGYALLDYTQSVRKGGAGSRHSGPQDVPQPDPQEG